MLVGVGVVPQIAEGTPSKMLMYVSLAGFLMQAIGTFLAHLFSADKAAVKEMIKDNNEETAERVAIAKAEAETTFVKKSDLRSNGT